MSKIINYISRHTAENLKSKLIVLYILNVTDIVFTLLLLNTGFFTELNCIMVHIVKSTAASIALKVLLPLLLLSYLYLRLIKASDKQKKVSNIVINVATLLYALINMLHIIWFFLLPSLRNVT